MSVDPDGCWGSERQHRWPNHVLRSCCRKEFGPYGSLQKGATLTGRPSRRVMF